MAVPPVWRGGAMQDVHELIAQDEHCDGQLEQYSPEFRQTVESNWREICNSILLLPNLVCQEFRFRFACDQTLNSINFWPPKLADSATLMTYCRRIIDHYFKARRLSIYINFSISFIVVEEDGSSHFVYASRSNFACLPNSILLHSETSYEHFTSSILPSFDLMKYITDVCDALDQRYDGIFLPVGGK